MAALAALLTAACARAVPPVIDSGLAAPDAADAASFELLATFSAPGGVAEIIAAAPDAALLAYTDSRAREVGLVDLREPRAPRLLGALMVPGEPTSVAATPDGRFFLAVVDGSPPSLVVVDAAARSVRATLPLGGQPDSIAVSPDGRYAAVAVENERDEEIDGGRMPQPPPGFLTIVDLTGPPEEWRLRDVSLTGLAERFPQDPEPEFVDVDAANRAAVTLQENNHVVIVDLASGAVSSHWSADTTTHAADTHRDEEARFEDRIVDARREPDAVAWTPDGNLVTANEGDYDLDLAAGEFTGGRDFTLFSAAGKVLFEPGADLERRAALAGRYPDQRSESKGIEPEGVEVGVYGRRVFLFVGAERGDCVAVYRLDGVLPPRFVQILPVGKSPEGLLALPRRGLFLTANEGDGTISIFGLTSRR